MPLGLKGYLIKVKEGVDSLLNMLFHMKNDKINWSLIGVTLAYVLMWGTGLFCTTFFAAIADRDFMEIFKDNNILKSVIAPSIVVLALFLWDEAAGVERTNLPLRYMKKQLKWNFIILGIALILIAITGLTNGKVQMISLILSWIGISAIKFISKYFSDLQIEINSVP